jgi:glycine cleavage system aminomethyltransferase T
VIAAACSGCAAGAVVHALLRRYGHTLGGAVGLSMVSGGGEKVTKQWMESGKWEVDVAGTRYPARVSAVPMYDPKNERIKA